MVMMALQDWCVATHCKRLPLDRSGHVRPPTPLTLRFPTWDVGKRTSRTMNEDNPSNGTGRPGNERPVSDGKHRSLTPHEDDSPRSSAVTGCGKSKALIERMREYLDCPVRYPLDSCQTESEDDSTNNVE